MADDRVGTASCSEEVVPVADFGVGEGEARGGTATALIVLWSGTMLNPLGAAVSSVAVTAGDGLPWLPSGSVSVTLNVSCPSCNLETSTPVICCDAEVIVPVFVTGVPPLLLLIVYV